MTSSHRPLKVGFILYNRERSLGGQTPRWADMLALATLDAPLAAWCESSGQLERWTAPDRKTAARR